MYVVLTHWSKHNIQHSAVLDRQIAAAPAVIQALSLKAELSIYVPTLVYSHELRVLKE